MFPVPEGTLQRVFGTSQVFRRVDDIKPKVVGLTVPLKVREYCHEGHQCLEQGDWETTVLLFSRALHLDSQLAEAYIQLCDFSSAAQNLQRAHSFQPEKASYLEHLTFVLYLQLVGAAGPGQQAEVTALWVSRTSVYSSKVPSSMPYKSSQKPLHSSLRNPASVTDAWPVSWPSSAITTASH